MALPISQPFTDKLQEHVFKAILWAPEDVIEEYKLQFLGIPVEVSRLDFFRPSNREEWVNPSRYCDFVRHKLFWSGDHFASGKPADRFWQGLRGQREQLQFYPTWRDIVSAAGPKSTQPSKEIIDISPDEDEEPIEEIVRRVRRKQKEKEVIVISSDSDEPMVEEIVSRKRKGLSTGESSQGPRKRRNKIRIFEPEAILVLDSDEEMTVVA